MRALLGNVLEGPVKRSAREERASSLLSWGVSSWGRGGLSLDDILGNGICAACHAYTRRLPRDARTAQELWPDMLKWVRDLLELSEGLRDADTDYDDADEVERDAMMAAQGAAIAAAGTDPDPARGRARAEDAFRAVRAATSRVLDMNIELKAKTSTLAYALRAAGLGFIQQAKRGLDLERFARCMDRSLAVAMRMQRRLDEEGGRLTDFEVTQALDAADPAAARRKAQRARMEQKRVRDTNAMALACEQVEALLQAVEASSPGITGSGAAPLLAFHALLLRVDQVLRRGDHVARALSDAPSWAPVMREISELMVDAPLDDVCARMCTRRAFMRYWEAVDAGDAASAFAKARERFDEAVVRATARHEERDADGEVVSCWGLDGALDTLFQAKELGPYSRMEAVNTAVRCAWEQTKAAGLSDVEGLARCLEAARPFDAKPTT